MTYNIANNKLKRIRFKDLKVGEFFIFVDDDNNVDGSARLKLTEDSYFNVKINEIIDFDESFYNEDSYVSPLNAEINLRYVYECEDE